MGENRVKRVIYPGFVTNLTNTILCWTVPILLNAFKLT
jgi:hypothetical protein